jgi:hypothetical protein
MSKKNKRLTKRELKGQPISFSQAVEIGMAPNFDKIKHLLHEYEKTNDMEVPPGTNLKENIDLSVYKCKHCNLLKYGFNNMFQCGKYLYNVEPINCASVIGHLYSRALCVANNDPHELKISDKDGNLIDHADLDQLFNQPRK